MVKVGDTIYFSRYGILHSKQTVTGVTPKGMIKTQSYKLRGDENHLHVLAQGTWSSTSAEIATPELDKQWEEMQLKGWFANNWSKISVEDIAKLKAKYEDN